MVVVPEPNWPNVFSPHVNSAPVVVVAVVKLLPADTDAQLLVPICTGEDLLIVVPSPSWPKLLLPHAQRLLSLVRIAKVASPKWDEITVQDVAIIFGTVCAGTCTGLDTLVTVFSPSCPVVFKPQAYNNPALIPKPKLVPAVTEDQGGGIREDITTGLDTAVVVKYY